MKVTAISDLHGHLPDIEPCDLLCICGDLSPIEKQRDHLQMWVWIFEDFLNWVANLPCDRVIFVPGNHDFWFEKYQHLRKKIEHASFQKLRILIDEEYIFYYFGIDPETNELCNIPYKIYGTPRCKTFGKWAFMHPECVLEDFYDKIPNDVDILLTHQPPSGQHNIGAYKTSYQKTNDDGQTYESFDWIEAGSYALEDAIEKKQPKYVVSGHIHDSNHTPITINNTTYINCSLLNDDYDLHYKPQIFEL